VEGWAAHQYERAESGNFDPVLLTAATVRASGERVLRGVEASKRRARSPGIRPRSTDLPGSARIAADLELETPFKAGSNIWSRA
jgi:hypothetical protein